MEAWNGLVARAQSDPEFLVGLKAAVKRILLLKLKELRGPRAVPITLHPQKMAMPVSDADPFVLQTTARGATVLVSGSLPWKPAGGAPLVVTPYIGAYRPVADRFPGASSLEYGYDFFGFDPAMLAQIVARVAASRRTVFVLATPGGVAYLKALEPYQDKVAVVSVLSPVYLREVPWVRDAVAVYGTNAEAFDVAAATLSGEIAPRGKLPFRFGNFPKDGR